MKNLRYGKALDGVLQINISYVTALRSVYAHRRMEWRNSAGFCLKYKEGLSFKYINQVESKTS